jgi:predicted metal-dependent peptidase
VRVAGALQQATRHGQAPASEVLVALQGLLQPELPWQALLEQHLRRVHGGAATWLPPNRRAIHRGLYLPGRREKVLQAVVAIDTSGSTRPYLGPFIDELGSLLGTFARYDVTVLCCDTQPQPPQSFSPDTPLTIDDLVLRGGGGTDLRPPFAWASEHHPPDVFVYLTDGHGPAPEHPPGYPVLWVLTPNGAPPAAWGTVARIMRGPF